MVRRAAGAGRLRVRVTVQNARAGRRDSCAGQLPPTRDDTPRRAPGVTIRDLDARPAARAGPRGRRRTRAGRRAARAPVAWRLSRRRLDRRLRRGRGAGDAFAFRVPRDARRASTSSGSRGARATAARAADRRARGAAAAPCWSSCRRSPGRAATRSTPTATGSPTRSTPRAAVPASAAVRGRRACRPGSSAQVGAAAALPRPARSRYDLTTDFALARGQRAGLRRAQGLVFAGSAALAARPPDARCALRPTAAGRSRRSAPTRFRRRGDAAPGAAWPSPSTPRGRRLRRAHAPVQSPPAPLVASPRRARAVRAAPTA